MCSTSTGCADPRSGTVGSSGGARFRVGAPACWTIGPGAPRLIDLFGGGQWDAIELKDFMAQSRADPVEVGRRLQRGRSRTSRRRETRMSRGRSAYRVLPAREGDEDEVAVGFD